ncbi:MAG: PAS domain S-box protein [Thermodesulfobacteriota bacterium]
MDSLSANLSEMQVDLFMVTDLRGKIVHQAAGRFAGDDVSWVWGLEEALAGKEILSTGLTPLGWTILKLTPLAQGSKLDGVLILGIPLNDAFARKIAAATHTQISFSSAYQILASSWPGEKPRPVDLSRATQSIMKRKALFFADADTNYSSFYIPIKIVDETLCLAIHTDTTPIFNLLQRKKGHLFLSFLGVLIVILGIGSGLTFTLVRPLRRLQQRALGVIKEFSREDVAVSRWGNEIETLSQAMELMLAAVRTHLADLHQTQEALKERELFLASVFANIQDGLTVLDRDFTILKANPSIEQRFPHSLPLEGRKCYAAFHGADQPCGGCPCLQAMETGQTGHQLKLTKIGETDVWVEIFAFPLKDQVTGEVTGVIEYARDFTERQQAEEALREARKDWEEIFQAIGNPTFLLDPEQNIIAANRAALAAVGCPTEELLGRKCYEVLHLRSDHSAPGCPMERLLSSGQMETMEMEVEALGGFYLVSCTPVFDARGNLEKVIHIATNITARRRAEEALRESEERYRSLVENIDLGITLIDTNYRIIMTNAAQGRLFNKPAEEFVGRECFREFEKRQAVCPHCPGTKAMTTGMPQEGETQGVLDDGSSLSVRINAFPIYRPDGALEGFIEVVHDISASRQAEEALRESEKKYRLLVNQIPAVVFRGYADWSIDVFDRKIESLTGYPKEDFDTRRRKWSDLILAEDLPAAKKIFLKALKTTGTYEREYRIRKKSGEIAWVQVQGQIFRDAAHRIDHISGVIFDVTQRKLAEEALLKYQFIANTSKDFMTLIDRNYLYGAANAAFCQAHGKTREEVVGTSVASIWGQNTFDQIIKDYLDQCFTGQAVEYEGWFDFGKRGRGCFNVSYNPYFNEDGTVAYAAVVTHDVTQRKLAKEALRESEEKYRLLVNQIPAVIFRGYADWSVEFFDEKIELLTGYPKDDFNSRRVKWLDLVHPEDREEMQGVLLKSLRASGSYVREYRIRKKYGEIAWVQGRGQIFLDSQGKIDHISGVFFDITDRKRAEEGLRQSEAKYRTLVEQIPAITYIASLDEELSPLYISPQAEAIMGFTPAEFLEFPGTWQNQLHPEDRDRVLTELDRSLNQGEPFIAEYRIFTKEGQLLWFHDHAWLVRDRGGQARFLQGVAMDITQRKRAEEALKESETRFRDIADHAMEWIWEVDADGRYLYSSSAVEKLLGYKPEEIINRHFSDLFHPDDREELTKAAQEVFAAKLPFREFINRNLHKDGRIVWLLTSGMPILDDQGNLMGYRGADTDITERLQAEQALKDSESFLASIFASIQDTIAILDKDLKIVRVNPAKERAFAPNLPLTGKKCYEVFHGTDQPCDACPTLQTLKTGEPAQSIITRHLADREGLRFLSLSTFPLRDEATGQVTGVVEVARDITEKQQAEEVIRERESMLSLVINAVPQAIFWKDLNSVYLGCNQNYARAAGLETPEEVVGKTEYDLPWGPEETETYLAEDREVMQSRQAKYHQVQTKLLADGRRIWVDGTKIPLLSADGGVMGVLGVYDDITERKRMEAALQESERRFRGLVENVPMGIMIVQDGEIIYQNPEQERLFGELRIKDCHDFLHSVHPDDAATAQQFCQGILAKTPQADVTLRLQDAPGAPQEKKLVWVNCRGGAIEYQGQENMLISMVDITRTKELEFLMLVREKMASLGQVAAGIAHEIRNPLSGINVFLESIKENFQDPESVADVMELIEAAQATSNKIEGVIKRVLDFSRPAELKLAPTDINLAVDDAIKLTAARLRKDNIKIDSSLAQDLPPVYADLHLLEQAIINMITNAAEALKGIGEPGRILIATQESKGEVLITIDDSGPGIPPAIRDKIFDPYFTTKSDGSGIGLSLCQRIVADHGGNIEVSPSDLGGSQFIIRIPKEKRGLTG